MVTNGVMSEESYATYLFFGSVSLGGTQFSSLVLRDTGSTICLWVRSGQVVGDIECELFTGRAQVGVVESLLENGVDRAVTRSMSQKMEREQVEASVVIDPSHDLPTVVDTGDDISPVESPRLRNTYHWKE